MVLGNPTHAPALDNFVDGVRTLKALDKVTYLGIDISADGTDTPAIKNRINKAWGRINEYGKLWRSRGFTRKSRATFFRCIAGTALFHGCKHWAPSKADGNFNSVVFVKTSQGSRSKNQLVPWEPEPRGTAGNFNSVPYQNFEPNLGGNQESEPRTKRFCKGNRTQWFTISGSGGESKVLRFLGGGSARTRAGSELQAHHSPR